MNDPETAIEVDPDRARALQRTLAEELAAKGALRSPEWKAVFERTPRHAFIPRFHRLVENDPHTPYRLLDGARSETRDEWLRAVYTDETWVTQLDNWIATSSSSIPSTMARMLEALDVNDGHRVLEIGTGTGYNAALLCERLGSERVTTVDIDPGLVTLAAKRLQENGYAPTVAAADGAGGYPPNAPYDRLIATCSVTRIPAAWLEQCRPGVIVTDLWGTVGHRGALVRLEVFRDGSARGRFLPEPGGFMALRSTIDTHEEWMGRAQAVLDQDGETRPTALPVTALEDEIFAIFAGFLLPSVWSVRRIRTEGVSLYLVHRDNVSWARLTMSPDGENRVVTQGGQRRLWDELEAAHERWLALGRPGRERFGLSVSGAGRQSVWIDTPDGGHAWELADPSREA